MLYRETDGIGRTLKFYAATKKTIGLMAHSSSYLFKLRRSGLRFITIYSL